MQLIKSFIDKKNFGNKVDIFKSEEGYIVITFDRGAIYYTYVDLEKKKLDYLKTNVFEKLANPTFRLMMNDSAIQGSNFYIEHSCYEKSKNIIELIK